MFGFLKTLKQQSCDSFVEDYGQEICEKVVVRAHTRRRLSREAENKGQVVRGYRASAESGNIHS